MQTGFRAADRVLGGVWVLLVIWRLWVVFNGQLQGSAGVLDDTVYLEEHVS